MAHAFGYSVALGAFIIAGFGLLLGATGEFLCPVSVAVSAITTLTTPWRIRASGPLANHIRVARRLGLTLAESALPTA